MAMYKENIKNVNKIDDTKDHFDGCQDNMFRYSPCGVNAKVLIGIASVSEAQELGEVTFKPLVLCKFKCCVKVFLFLRILSQMVHGTPSPLL